MKSASLTIQFFRKILNGTCLNEKDEVSDIGGEYDGRMELASDEDKFFRTSQRNLCF